MSQQASLLDRGSNRCKRDSTPESAKCGTDLGLNWLIFNWDKSMRHTSGTVFFTPPLSDTSPCRLRPEAVSRLRRRLGLRGNPYRPGSLAARGTPSGLGPRFSPRLERRKCGAWHPASDAKK